MAGPAPTSSWAREILCMQPVCSRIGRRVSSRPPRTRRHARHGRPRLSGEVRSRPAPLVAAHRPCADHSAAGALTLPRLRRRGLDDDEVDRRVVAQRPAEHRAPRPCPREGPHHHDAVGPPQGAPDRHPVPCVHQGSPDPVGKRRESRRPRLAHGVAVDGPGLGGNQRRLAGAGEAGHHDDVVRVRGEEHAPHGGCKPLAQRKKVGRQATVGSLGSWQ